MKILPLELIFKVFTCNGKSDKFTKATYDNILIAKFVMFLSTFRPNIQSEYAISLTYPKHFYEHLFVSTKSAFKISCVRFSPRVRNIQLTR